MEFLRCAIALVVCWSLCFPAPLAFAQDAASGRDAASSQVAASNEQSPTPQKHRADYVSTQLEGNARILHALNRFTFGPRPGDLEAVREMGLDKWFDAQLHPESLDETDLNTRLAEYPAMQWSARDLMFRMPGPAIIRQVADGKIDVPGNGTLHAVYENQVYRYQMRKAAQAEKQTATANQGQSAAPGTQGPAPNGNGSGDGNGDANMDRAANSSANPNMDASAGTTPNGTAAQQPDTSASGPAMYTDPATNAMAPAPGQDADQARGRGARAEQRRDDRADADGYEQDRRDQDPGQPTEGGTVGENSENHHDDRDAEKSGHFPVLRGRLDLLADQGLLEDQVLQRHQGKGHDDDREVL